MENTQNWEPQKVADLFLLTSDFFFNFTNVSEAGCNLNVESYVSVAKTTPSSEQDLSLQFKTHTKHFQRRQMSGNNDVKLKKHIQAFR